MPDVREAISRRGAVVKALAVAAVLSASLSVHVLRLDARGAADAVEGADAVAEALLLGHPMPDAVHTAKLPSDVQKRLSEYRQREAVFKSGLTPPPGANDEERALYEQRVGIERVVFCLFPRRETPQVAASYALDADLDREDTFIDDLLTDLPVPWLAPYLNLVGGHRKLCVGHTAAGAQQLDRARRGGPLLRLAADYLLAGNRCISAKARAF